MENPVHELQVWLIDDDDDDHVLFARAIGRSPLRIHFRSFPNAVAAIKELSQAVCVSPDLIICDLKMPALSGDTFVRWLRSTRHGSVPVVMRSTSDVERDVFAAYEAGANAFVTKGMTFDATVANVRAMVDFATMLKRQTTAHGVMPPELPSGSSGTSEP